MKKKIGIFALLIVGFILFIIIRFAIQNSGGAYGKLKIISSPASSVFINNVAIGKIPYEDKYKVGEYLLKLIPEDSATQTASWQRKINIYKNALTYVNLELGSTDISTAGDVLSVEKLDKVLPGDKGEISIDTEPTGAIIYLDNDEKGVASATLTDVTKGDHELSIFMPGFFRRTMKVNIVPGYRVNAYVKLAVDPNQSPNFKIEDRIKDATPSASGNASSASGKESIKIFGTPEGTLNVREDASIEATKAATVNEGDTFEILETQGTWFKIEYEKGSTGWISSEYTRKLE